MYIHDKSHAQTLAGLLHSASAYCNQFDAELQIAICECGKHVPPAPLLICLKLL